MRKNIRTYNLSAILLSVSLILFVTQLTFAIPVPEEKNQFVISGRVYSQNVLSVSLPKPVKQVQIVILAPDLSPINSKTFTSAKFEMLLTKGEKYLMKIVSPGLNSKVVDIDLSSLSKKDSLGFSFPDKSLILYEENKKINSDLFDFVKSFLTFSSDDNSVKIGDFDEEKHLHDYKKENEEKGFFGKLVDQTVNLPKEIVNQTISLPKNIVNLTKEVIPFHKKQDSVEVEHIKATQEAHVIKKLQSKDLLEDKNVSESVGEIIKNTQTERERTDDSLENHPLYKMTKDLFALKMSDLDEAKENIELAKLKARTKEDRMLIELKEKEIILAEKELLQAELQNQKQLKEINEEKEKVLMAESKLKVQKIFLYASIVVGLLILTFFFFLLRNYKQKKRANEIISRQKARVEEANEELNQINEEILAQRDEIEKQRIVVEKKNKEITSSIVYAKRIQNAILPATSYIDKYLPQNFVFYKPKDIVAGDFYWVQSVDDKLVFAVADCTGHGVPGAMVSVVCHNALNRAVLEFGILNPGEILDKVRGLVIETFEKSENSVQDGMDICLCVLDKKTNTLEYAGANNSLYLVGTLNKELEGLGVKEFKVDGFEKSLFEIKPTKQPIGLSKIADMKYQTSSIKLTSDIISIYLFSDGYADQFGGKQDRKFSYKELKKILLMNSEKSMETQELILEKALHDWMEMGDEKQIDDICLMGVKFS